MDKSNLMLLRFASLLWVVWGLVHLGAGVAIASGDVATSLQNIADAVAPEQLVMNYPAAASGVFKQHGWNLAWIGLVTILGAVKIWNANKTAIWVTAMVGGFADLGYFIFIDLAGYAKFAPGTVMTIISACAIALTGWVYFTNKKW